MSQSPKLRSTWKEEILRGEVPRDTALRTYDLADERQLAGLPEGLHGFSLDARRTPLRTLPSGLRIDYKIDLTDCAALESLPAGLRTGSLVLTRCTALQALPEGLDVHFLTLNNCTRLETWPATARVSVGSISARNCPSLRRLPATLETLTNLDLRGCRLLDSLPAGLKLTGWLDVADTGITSLPPSLEGVALRWRGVAINAQIAFFPETLTAGQITAEPNAEVRRVMLERHGVDNFMREANASVLDEDTDPGGPRRLLSLPLPGDEPLVCVSVRCPSTGRQYLIRVPPTIKTCHAAVAWTAGYDNPDDYHPLVET